MKPIFACPGPLPLSRRQLLQVSTIGLLGLNDGARFLCRVGRAFSDAPPSQGQTCRVSVGRRLPHPTLLFCWNESYIFEPLFFPVVDQTQSHFGQIWRLKILYRLNPFEA